LLRDQGIATPDRPAHDPLDFAGIISEPRPRQKTATIRRSNTEWA